MCVQVYALLGQTSEERKAFLKGERVKGHISRLPPRVYIRDNPHLPFIRPPYK